MQLHRCSSSPRSIQCRSLLPLIILICESSSNNSSNLHHHPFRHAGPLVVVRTINTQRTHRCWPNKEVNHFGKSAPSPLLRISTKSRGDAAPKISSMGLIAMVSWLNLLALATKVNRHAIFKLWLVETLPKLMTRQIHQIHRAEKGPSPPMLLQTLSMGRAWCSPSRK